MIYTSVWIWSQGFFSGSFSSHFCKAALYQSLLITVLFIKYLTESEQASVTAGLYSSGGVPALTQGEVFILARKVRVSSRRRCCTKPTRSYWHRRRAEKKQRKFHCRNNKQKITWTNVIYYVVIYYKPSEFIFSLYSAIALVSKHFYVPGV